MKKRILSLALALLLTLTVSSLAMAAGGVTPEITWLDQVFHTTVTVYYIPEFDLFCLAGGTGFTMAGAGTGRTVTSETYDGILPFSEGLAVAVKADESGNMKYGYIDQTSAVVIPLEYDNFAGDFSDGLVRFIAEDADGHSKWGYIDTTGAVVVPPKYDVVSYFGGLFFVGKYDADRHMKSGIIGPDGAVVVPVEYDFCNFAYANTSQDPSRFCYVAKGNSIGVFENPYYQGE